MMSLFDAIYDYDFSMVKEIIKNNSDINQTNEYGYSALHIASSKGLEEIAIFLIEHGINVNLQDPNGQTVLHYAAVYNQLKLAKAALSNGGDLSIEDMHGNQPLWTAVFNDKGRNDRVEFVKMYIENGADENHKNKVAKSPKDIVMIASYNNLKLFMKFE
jgi:uncharacterized protein